jgi:hypothetical protein
MRLIISGVALALAVALSGATSPAEAKTGHAPWCVNAPWQAEFNCNFYSLTRCKEISDATDGGCELNPDYWPTR